MAKSMQTPNHHTSVVCPYTVESTRLCEQNKLYGTKARTLDCPTGLHV